MPGIVELLRELEQANPHYRMYATEERDVVAIPRDSTYGDSMYTYNGSSPNPRWSVVEDPRNFDASRYTYSWSASDGLQANYTFVDATPTFRYVECPECGRTYRMPVAEYESATFLCDRCKAQPIAKCAICGEEHRIVWTCGDDREYGVCRKCHVKFTDEHPINRFNFKPTPKFYGEPQDKAYFGVEVEVDYGVNAWLSAAKVTHDFEEIYVKHDGSLEEEGIEVVTHPASLAYHKTQFPWDDILDCLAEFKYQADTTNTCGLHIHISRNFFGESEVEQDCNIAKLILIVQRFWESHLVPFSRRNIGRLERWAKKPEFKFNTNASIGSIIETQKRSLCRDHYNGINILPPYTVEFRMFRGSMKKNIIFASMELVYALSRFAKTIELRDIDVCTWEQIFTGLNRDEFRCLFDYMENKCLFDSSRTNTIFDENYIPYEFMREEAFEVRRSLTDGDFAVIRDWDSMAAEFPTDTWCGQQRIRLPNVSFIEDMKPLCGCKVRITEVDDYAIYLESIDANDNHNWSAYTFTRDMLRAFTTAELLSASELVEFDPFWP